MVFPDGAGEGAESAVMAAGAIHGMGKWGKRPPLKSSYWFKMSNLLKWSLVALVVFGLLWFLQSRVGPQDVARQELAVDANAIR